MKTDFYRLVESEASMIETVKMGRGGASGGMGGVAGGAPWVVSGRFRQPAQRNCNALWRAWTMTVCLVAGLAFLPGCASAPANNDPAAKLGQRALERWQALIAGDVAKAYEYFSPGSKQETSLEVYKSKVRPGLWRTAEVKEASCQEAACSVTMTIVYDHKLMKGVRTDIKESWVLVDGEAWYIFR